MIVRISPLIDIPSVAKPFIGNTHAARKSDAAIDNQKLPMRSVRRALRGKIHPRSPASARRCR
jgi:hypothetical protein